VSRIVVETASRYESPQLPQQGEVWLCVESGNLYEMRERADLLYRACHRVGAPERFGCDPSVKCACWDSAVREGRWIRVLNCPPLTEKAKP
jgi:hypothetical protein